ncbi:MAG TPA: MAPEG family protein [Gammaproteobacteria bacterium]|nr:MAPEG family protein [Gammaproteobacteria bacterium]|tara:strand:+ start:987 stop:1397 length:411 start_codon:yes stop_codon:yes gene_type:complete
MSASIICLFGLIIWSITLILLLLGARAKYFLGGQLVFDQQGIDLGGTSQRITRAQANSLEWLVIPSALLIYGIANGQSEITDGLAMVVLGSRILQSIVHIVSVSLLAILVRATLFTIQVVVWVIWSYEFYSAAALV